MSTLDLDGLSLELTLEGDGSLLELNTDAIEVELDLSPVLRGPAGPSGGEPGLDGTDGATWRSGAGAPSNALGADGDYYLNTANGDVYLRAAGAYSVTINLKGTPGTNGQSAYQIAVAGGFVGTEAQWLASLEGPPGGAAEIAAEIAAATDKTTPVDADQMPLLDSTAANALRKITWANIKAALKTYFDTLYAPTAQPFDVHAFYPGVPAAGAVLLRTPLARAVSFADEFAGSYARASAAATGSSVFDLRKNGVSVGSITFAAAASSGTFATSGAAVAFAAGDILSIHAPATADATLADVGIVLAGTR